MGNLTFSYELISQKYLTPSLVVLVVVLVVVVAALMSLFFSAHTCANAGNDTADVCLCPRRRSHGADATGCRG